MAEFKKYGEERGVASGPPLMVRGERKFWEHKNANPKEKGMKEEQTKPRQ